MHIFNLHYKDSAGDYVHYLPFDRLENIYAIFGQLPAVLKVVWIAVAEGEKERAPQIIDAVPYWHPLEIRYTKVENVEW